jgi:hypothetical protein
MISDCCGVEVRFEDICPKCGEHCEDQMISRDDIEFFVENEIGGYVADNYTIVEKSNGLAVQCGQFATDALTDDNFSSAIYNLVSEVSYNLVYENL